MSFVMPDIFMLIGNIFGCLLALAVAPFLAFWVSAVRKRSIVVIGAFIGALIGFAILFLWGSSVPGANGGTIFFSSALLCTTLGVTGGIITDLLVGRATTRDYRQHVVHES